MIAFFYLFAFVIVLSSLLAVLNKNPVHSVLYLILTFISTSGLFIVMKAEFIAMVLAIVYVGAIAVLFLFIVMMLPIKHEEESPGFSKNYLLIILICISLASWIIYSGSQPIARVLLLPIPVTVQYLGSVLYTKYIYIFQLAGVILLVAMVASISLTLHKSKNIKRQSIRKQLSRSSKIKLIDVESGKGVDI
jgi:NADH-quinone oxidoreductase subunit J